MIRRTIEKVLNEKFEDWLKSIKDKELQKLVEKNTIITGGAIVSLLQNEEPNDYDLYFANKETTIEVAQYYVDMYNKDNDTNYEVLADEDEDRVQIRIPSSGVAEAEEEIEDSDEEEGKKFSKKKKTKGKYIPLMITSNAISLTNDVQLIIRFYGDAEEVHKNFDFVHTMNYWESDTGQLTLNPQALESILTKRLIYVGSLYPVASIVRIRKFLKRGWHISAGQILKIAYQISKLDLDNVDVLESQLIGVDIVYFRRLIEDLKAEVKKDANFEVTQSYLAELIDRIFE